MKTLFACFLVLTISVHANSLALEHSGDKVEGAVRMQVWAFPLEEVRLLNGTFKSAQDWTGLSCSRWIPTAEQLRGKSKITVKFRAPTNAPGGSVSGVRVMKPAANTTATGT